MNKIIVGSRGSQLALKQTEWVIEQLKRIHPEKNFVIKKIKTKGDKILDSPLSKIVAQPGGTKGLFTKEIEDALLRKEIDFAVHSIKDLPTDIPEGLTIGAMPQREETADVLITKNNLKFERLPKGAKIGTSSLRRKAQILAQRPDLEIVDLRGNLDTRIRKLKEQNLDGIIVASAGLKRLSRCIIGKGIHLQILTFMFPAVGQGAIGVEIRDTSYKLSILLPPRRDADAVVHSRTMASDEDGQVTSYRLRDKEIREMVSQLNDEQTAACVQAERAFLKRLGGGCQVPIGVRSNLVNSNLVLEGIVLSTDGKKYFRDKISCPLKEAINLGVRLAENLISLGAKELLLQ